MTRLKEAFFVCAIFCMIAITAVVVKIGDQVTQAVSDVSDVAVQAKSDVHETQLEIGDQLIQIHAVLDGFSDAETEQRKYWMSTAKQSTDVVRDLRLLLAHADRTTLPLTNQAIRDFSAHSTETLEALTISSKSLGNAADSLNKQVSNPQIAETFDNIDRATHSLSQTSAHLDNISAMGEVEVKRLTMPASLAKRMVFGGLTVAGKLGSAFAGFK